MIQNRNEKEQSAAELSDGASLRNLDHRNSFRPHFTAVKSTFSLKKIQIKKKRFRDEFSFRTLCNNTCTSGNSHTLRTKTASHKLTLQFELPINKHTSNFGLR